MMSTDQIPPRIAEALHDLQARVARLESAAQAAPTPLPLTARTSLIPSRGRINLFPSRLQPHAAQIAAWRDAGLGYAAIAARLHDQGVQTSVSALSRFCRTRLCPVDLSGSGR